MLPRMTSPTEAFLSGARAVLAAVSDPIVAEQWDAPSVLEGQTVAGLVGHLARGAVWAVGDYMSAGEPDGPLTFESAGAYYAFVADATSEADHGAIRQRGAQVAAEGHAALVERLTDRIAGIESQLRKAGPDRRVAVIAGAVVRLGDYLQTRVVEQVVHLDDLARSVGKDWPVPDECVAIALAVAVDIGRLRFGDAAMVRALYRHTASDVLPVL